MCSIQACLVGTAEAVAFPNHITLMKENQRSFGESDFGSFFVRTKLGVSGESSRFGKTRFARVVAGETALLGNVSNPISGQNLLHKLLLI
jgi:hypothetical protein